MLLRAFVTKVGKADLSFGGPIIPEGCVGNVPCCGDSTKHSSSDMKDPVLDECPPPNLKGGS